MAENSGVENRWTRLREIVHRTRATWWAAGAILLAALFIVILWKIPQIQVGRYANAKPPMEAKDQFNSENAARQTLATMLGGLVLLVGAYFTWRNIKLTQQSVATAQNALIISQEGQITDRFTKAIEQLGAVDASGKKKLEVRLGGIYALERIANQSERDYWPIVEVLSTYVRENAPLKPQESPPKNEVPTRFPPTSPVAPPPPAADIQAILTVLNRRNRNYEKENQHLDLTNTDIRRANLGWANLWEANLSGAYLREADLNRAALGGRTSPGRTFALRTSARRASPMRTSAGRWSAGRT